MIRPQTRGALFIVVEGPNGVGKTTASTLLAARLRADGARVHLTSEPSRTPLGRLIRADESRLRGRALALAVAADRYHHLATEITPALEDGQTVISDRYVQSSLVLQRLDGLEVEEIWQYNAHVLPASLSCYLHHTAQELGRRLAERARLSRLEQAGSPERELDLYRDTYRFLLARHWPQAIVDCQDRSPDRVAAELAMLVARTAQRQEDIR
ncbi:dTMP kinase [Nonomuraea sp. NPDC050783]|uniref:dTMP kinase n=1 Tax=Nonomuraea sp. NPDC050783 TaxID=3154634 RepID=UPI003464FF53